MTSIESLLSSDETDFAQLEELLSCENVSINDTQAAEIIFRAAPSDEFAERILTKHQFDAPSTSVLTKLLSLHVKPLFQKNPHPRLNTETARKLPRAVSGLDDYFEDQLWKSTPGIEKVILWAIRHIQTEQYETLWHLLIPPVMTYMDDYQPAYKVHGVEMVNEILKAVPPELLKRTGLDELLRSSLSNALFQLRDPHTPTLLALTVPTTVNLITRTCTLGSQQYFDRLCELLGEGIIGGVWMYGPDEDEVGKETMIKSLEVVPVVLRALGIGSARFLKGLIPQITHVIVSQSGRPGSWEESDVRLVEVALKALRCVMEECSVRIHGWKATICNAIARCWVALIESQKGWKSRLEIELKETCRDLQKHCPTVIQNEYATLLRLDSKMFGELLGMES